jgi:hypothetical protein
MLGLEKCFPSPTSGSVASGIHVGILEGASLINRVAQNRRK